MNRRPPVDPRARIQMRVLLRELADLGKAVLVSSHILPELSDVCDTVGILSGGKLIASGPVQEILRAVRQRRLMEITVLKDSEKAMEILRAAAGDWTIVKSDTPLLANTLRCECQCDERQLARSLFLLLKGGIAVTHFYEVPADLEDVFMTLTK